MRLVVVASFLNEERYLPTFLESLGTQTRPPDLALLVNDGSTDRSGELSAKFAAEHEWARAIDRPPRPPERDRLATAAELKSFHWGVEQIDVEYDVVTKLDTDLKLTPRTFETIVGAIEADSQLGIAGAYLSAPRGPGGAMVRETNPPDHVRGPTKFYRRECFEQIQPVPPILGWDTIDDIKARMHGWQTRSLEMPDGDPVHLRPVGTHDGALRGYRRWGECAWGFGAHPLHVALGGVRRVRERPYLAAGASYVAGWALAGLRRRPRADADVREFVRAEELARIRGMVRGRGLAGAGGGAGS